ncbi:MAG: pdxH [Chthoniobacteraceae bacterium]|nr:pdxH [Chthoniobacteraceae bacterium]
MNLADLRSDYRRGTLEREDLNADPIAQFKVWMRAACESGMIEPTAMSLATVDADGGPLLRTVLLKGIDARGFVFFTNLKSRKARHLAHNPHASLLFPWLALERQVIVTGRTEKLSVAESLRYFLTRPRNSQLSAWASAQSSIIASRKMLEMEWAQIKAKFGDGEIPLPSFWGGYCVEPRTVEFWQGRAGRLHDRFEYTRQPDDAWRLDRLAP